MYAQQRPGPRFDSVAVHERKFKKKESPRWHGGEERNSTGKDTPMSAPIPNLMTVEQLAEHYGKAKKTIQNKLTRGWGPTPVTDPDTMQVLGFEVEEVARFDRINKQTRKQRLYA